MAMEHVPPEHASKVGKRYPACVEVAGVSWLMLELDLSAVVPESLPRLRSLLMYKKTLAPETARDLGSGEWADVVLIEDIASDGYATVSLPADPEWLTWNNGTVRQLAKWIRETGESILLPILADALEEAGCTDRLTLNRCRQPEDDDLSWLLTLLVMQE